MSQGTDQTHKLNIKQNERNRTGHAQPMPTSLCLQRIKRDLHSFLKQPPEGIFVTPDSSDVTVVHALIVGPRGTPYEHGFFYFYLSFPPIYPCQPPRVKLMTTGGSKVRFNPNLYKCGEVCLSILGTWTGPSWTPALTLTTVLLSIQSLLNEKPYHNEPGFESEHGKGSASLYSKMVQHETLRVAVVGMLDNDFGVAMPSYLRERMEEWFLQHYDFYKTLASKMKSVDGKLIKDPLYNQAQGSKYQYGKLLGRLAKTRDRLRGAGEPSSVSTEKIKS